MEEITITRIEYEVLLLKSVAAYQYKKIAVKLYKVLQDQLPECLTMFDETGEVINEYKQLVKGD